MGSYRYCRGNFPLTSIFFFNERVPACHPERRRLDYTGLSMEVSVDWGWKVAIHPDDLERLMKKWLGLLASGEPGDEEPRLLAFDGTYRWFLFRAHDRGRYH